MKRTLKTLLACITLLLLATAPALAENDADITQWGTTNDVDIYQVGDGDPTVDQLSTVYQEGESNGTIIYQTGEDNLATVEQIGLGNTAYMEQYNLGNAASVTQYDTGNNAVVLQYGNLDTATIYQDGLNNDTYVNQQ